MMNNLFSMFDPSSSVMKLNWVCVFTPVFFVPISLWNYNSTMFKLNLIMKNTIGSMKQSMSEMKMSHFFMTSVILVILLSNLSSLLPLTFPVNSHLAAVLPLSLLFWFTPLYFKWVKAPFNTINSLLPQGTPGLLMPFMVLIETISLTIRPLTLSVRLVANITAGHLLLSILVNLIKSMENTIVFTLFIVMMNLLETGVSMIQAYVFFTLLSMYTSEI